MDYGEKAGVKKDEKCVNDSRDEIIYSIKALIARNLFDYAAYFKVVNQVDDEFQKAVGIIKDNSLFDKLSIKY